MVEPDTYGVWEETERGYEKSGDDFRYVIEVRSEYEVYCFVRHNEHILEFSKDVQVYIEDLCTKIMKRESHSEDIVDVLEDMGFNYE